MEILPEKEVEGKPEGAVTFCFPTSLHKQTLTLPAFHLPKNNLLVKCKVALLQNKMNKSKVFATTQCAYLFHYRPEDTLQPKGQGATHRPVS